MWFHGTSLAAGDRLKIIGIGYPDNMVPCMVDRPHGTDNYLFMYFPTPVQVWSEGAIRPFPAHTLFLWTPGNRHTFGHPQRRWCHCWMHCAGPVVDRLVTASRIPVNQPLALANSYLPDHYLKPIHDELKETRDPDFPVLEAYLTLLIRMTDRTVNPDRQESRIPERVMEASHYLNAHLAQPITLTALADHVHLSVSRFSAEFRAAMGTSPMRFLLEQRLLHAVHLLRDRNLNIAEVSRLAGFNDPFYFSRQFCRKYGQSPLHYRRTLS